MPQVRNARPRRDRRGTVLIIALALLILGSALLAGSSSASRATGRAARTYEAVALGDAESRSMAANYLMGWSAAEDSLTVGGDLSTSRVDTIASFGATPVVSTIRLKRLSALRFVLAVECRIGPPASVLAIRRMRIVLQRAAPADSTVPPPPPVPIRHWAASDLY